MFTERWWGVRDSLASPDLRQCEQAQHVCFGSDGQENLHLKVGSGEPGKLSCILQVGGKLWQVMASFEKKADPFFSPGVPSISVLISGRSAPETAV